MLRLLLWAFVAFVVVLVVDGWQAIGTSAPTEHVRASPQWADGQFRNALPLHNSPSGAFRAFFSPSEYIYPDAPIPTATHPLAGPADPWRVTWLGHSTVLIELDGVRVLTDPVFSERISPFSWLGPARFYPPPIALDALPPIDAVLISHDHYDHLDLETIKALRDRTERFVVPVGVAADLAYWDVAPSQIVELDWWQEVQVGAVRVVATPARHASGRFILDNDESLWVSYALVGPEHRAFFSGDTGYFPEFAEIGERLGPFDVTMIEAGAYNRNWPDWHLGPEQAVKAHQALRGDVLIPVHWGLFNLALHAWTAPIERVRLEADAVGVRVASPRPGGSVTPSQIPDEIWWPSLPFDDAVAHPVVSTQLD